jgi:hypothetical protein
VCVCVCYVRAMCVCVCVCVCVRARVFVCGNGDVAHTPRRQWVAEHDQTTATSPTIAARCSDQSHPHYPMVATQSGRVSAGA